MNELIIRKNIGLHEHDADSSGWTGTDITTFDSYYSNYINNNTSVSIISVPTFFFVNTIIEREYMRNKELLLINAIRNLNKKINLLELNESLNNEEISDDEYMEEIDDNSYKYTIELNDVNSENEVNCIKDIISQVGLDIRDFSVSEVSEMFGFKENSIVTCLNNFKGYLK